ncbi:MAG: putative addiction module antidote protein [Bdellovibrionales bacterium RIFOXYD1_FULL_53_11]|nr:MAG: putative addiction module antidote protein [Bdellovibrionales bacterium RIFOXYD1_FULL_53_11]
MAKQKKIKAVSVDSTVTKQLKDPEVAAAYVSSCLEERSKHRGALLLQALMDVAKARGISNLAKGSETKRRMIYKALSEKANPSLQTLEDILENLGLALDVRPLKKAI